MSEPLMVISQADLTALTSRLERIEAILTKVEMTPQKDLLTMAEMAELMGRSEATVRRRMNAGLLETKEVGGKIMFRRP